MVRLFASLGEQQLDDILELHGNPRPAGEHQDAAIDQAVLDHVRRVLQPMHVTGLRARADPAAIQVHLSRP